MTDNLALEKTLWKAADKLRNNMDAAVYKHVVLGLIFLKYISDAFTGLYNHLETTKDETGADPEDKDEYTVERVFYVPPQARWKWLQGRAKLPSIGKDIDDAMDSIERDNPSLKGVLPKDYARPALNKQRLGELIDLIGSITLSKGGNGKGKDLLGFVFEYFLGQFADAEGKKGGQFYTPHRRDAMHGVSTMTVNEPINDNNGLTTNENPIPQNHPEYKNKFAPQSKNLSSIIRGYKSAVTTYARKNVLEFDWQSRFHDHIIRNSEEYHRISNYILNNPAKWQKDKFFK